MKVSTDKGPVTPISDGDLGLLRLQQTELVLTRTLEQLEREKLDTEKEARSHLRESRREAVSYTKNVSTLFNRIVFPIRSLD